MKNIEELIAKMVADITGFGIVAQNKAQGGADKLVIQRLIDEANLCIYTIEDYVES